MATITKKAAASIATLVDCARWAGERKARALRDEDSFYDFWDAAVDEAIFIIELADTYGIKLALLDHMRAKVDFYKAKLSEFRPHERT
tara:strand:+ start:356 stop:619 length:264 start_codon:yes stop_codon:yes gene_type:complete